MENRAFIERVRKFPRTFRVDECMWDPINKQFTFILIERNFTNAVEAATGTPKEIRRIVHSNKIDNISCIDLNYLGADFNAVLSWISGADEAFKMTLENACLRRVPVTSHFDYYKYKYMEDELKMKTDKTIKVTENKEVAITVRRTGNNEMDRAIVDLERLEYGEAFRVVDGTDTVFMVVKLPKAYANGDKLVACLDTDKAEVVMLKNTTRVWVYKKLDTRLVVEDFLREYEVE